MCTAGGRKRPPDAIQLPSTVQCSCSCTTSTHHYSNLNFVILFFFLCFWKLWKKNTHVLLSKCQHLYRCIQNFLKWIDNWELEIFSLHQNQTAWASHFILLPLSILCQTCFSVRTVWYQSTCSRKERHWRNYLT